MKEDCLDLDDNDSSSDDNDEVDSTKETEKDFPESIKFVAKIPMSTISKRH